MKHPFWIVNSTLLFLFLFVLAFMYFSRVQIPDREEISMPRHRVRTARSKDTKAVAFETLYEKDLFNTYQPVAGPLEELPSAYQIPNPPHDLSAYIPQTPAPHFLEPLDITLKGIIVMRRDTTKNAAIFEDNKTKEEGTYHVGDTWEDAQLISVFNNKIVFLRSNGQQEVLYLREQDAKLDPAYLAVDGWQDVVRQIGVNEFALDPVAFKKRVKNLAQFIDLLGLTSAYRKGISIGCRIGIISAKSLSGQLGLHSGDIVLSVNGIPIGSTKERFKAYEAVINAPESEPITVDLLRAGKEFSISIVRQRLQEDGTSTTLAGIEEVAEARRATDHAIKEQRKYASTVDKMRQRDRKNMKHKSASLQGTA